MQKFPGTFNVNRIQTLYKVLIILQRNINTEIKHYLNNTNNNDILKYCQYR